MILRSSGKLGKLRNLFKKIFYTIQDDLIISQHGFLMEKIKQEYIEAHKLAMKDVSSIEESSFSGKFSCLIPKGGIVHNNVQRMLLSSGSEKYLNNVPMAIFVEDLQQ